MNIMNLTEIKFNRKNFALVGTLVILVAIPLTVVLLGVRQELRKRAAVTGSILINAGAETTNSREVTLTLTAPNSSQSFLGVPQAQAADQEGGFGYLSPSDFNGDRTVNVLDYRIFVENYGKRGEE